MLEPLAGWVDLSDAEGMRAAPFPYHISLGYTSGDWAPSSLSREEIRQLRRLDGIAALALRSGRATLLSRTLRSPGPHSRRHGADLSACFPTPERFICRARSGIVDTSALGFGALPVAARTEAEMPFGRFPPMEDEGRRNQAPRRARIEASSARVMPRRQCGRALRSKSRTEGDNNALLSHRGRLHSVRLGTWAGQVSQCGLPCRLRVEIDWRIQ